MFSMNLTMPSLFRSKKRVAAQTAPPPVKSPDALRRELRASLEQVGRSYFEFGEVVIDDAIADCRVYANRHRAIETLPKGGVVTEVGTQTGRFAEHIFTAAKPEKLHLFDLSREWFDSSLLVEPIRQGLVEIHLGDSSTELGKFPAEHFDWLYIDGDHSYAGVK